MVMVSELAIITEIINLLGIPVDDCDFDTNNDIQIMWPLCPMLYKKKTIYNISFLQIFALFLRIDTNKQK